MIKQNYEQINSEKNNVASNVSETINKQKVQNFANGTSNNQTNTSSGNGHNHLSGGCGSGSGSGVDQGQVHNGRSYET
jgi:hypothetical protein